MLNAHSIKSCSTAARGNSIFVAVKKKLLCSLFYFRDANRVYRDTQLKMSLQRQIMKQDCFETFETYEKIMMRITLQR